MLGTGSNKSAHVMPSLMQLGNEVSTKVTRAAGDEHIAHGVILVAPKRGARRRTLRIVYAQ